MPNIQNIASMVAGAEARHLMVEAGRCVEVRHRMAQCGACMETCPEDAIQVKDNRITVIPELCRGCGSCASECPTQALHMVQPSEADLLAFVDTAADELFAGELDHEPVLEFSCEHAPASSADVRIVVPALPYVDEAVLLHAAANGFDSIALTCCGDDGCLRPTLAAMPDILATARALLEACGSSCKIVLRKQKPRPQEEGQKERRGRASEPRGGESQQTTMTAGNMMYGNRDYSRRGMISDMASQAKTIVAETAAAELRDRLGQQEAEPTLIQTLTDGKGNMLKFAMPRAESVLNDLYVMNPEPAGAINVRGFARVEVNAAACTCCGMCARFCPTGALECEERPIGNSYGSTWHSLADPWAQAANQEGGALSFRISDCVGCHLCETACPLHCLHVNDEVDASTIFDLEPADLLQ
ncbi:MAG: 4Fe-4S binding protein [Coriobacteriaceae bacterium]|nr:4Fe-4S binding protein [Coriobacteriaceae bacterium]